MIAKPPSSFKELLRMPLFARALPSFLFLLCAAAQAQPVFEKMNQAAADFQGLTADVVRTHYTEVADEKETSKGTLVVQRDKPKEYKALFRVAEPDPQRIAYGGRKVSIYNPKTNVISVYDFDKKMGSKVNDYLLLGFGATSKELQQTYNISLLGPEPVNGQKATKLLLMPKSPEKGAELTKAELWISDDTGVATQQKFYAQGGDYDLVTYSNMKVNPSNSPSVELNPPRDAKTEHPMK
jgi:outer membrane lipoprotein-sorting protein